MTLNLAVPVPIPVELGAMPCEKRSAFRFKLDFSLGLSQFIDLATFYNQATIKSIQSMYVNNRGNTSPVSFTMNGTNQVLTVPANAQAYLPVLDQNPPTIQIDCTNATGICFVQLLNFFTPPFMWGQDFTVTIAALSAIIVNSRLNVRTAPQVLSSDTDRSGTITVGGTGQVLMAANASRAQWTLQNPSTATEILQFSKVGLTGPWYDLIPGATASENGITIYQGSMWIIAATTAHAFTADEGNS